MGVLNADDSEMLTLTRGLIGYIGDLVNSGSRAVRDCEKYDSVIWLADLPTTVARPVPGRDGPLLVLDYVARESYPRIPEVLRGWLEEGAAADPRGPAPKLATEGPVAVGRDDALPSLPESTRAESSTVPVLAGAYREWLTAWLAWSQRERDAEPVRKLYQKLADLARRTAQADDVYEVVLAVGLLQRHARQPVLRHVLTQRVDIQINKDSGSLAVLLDPAALTRMEDHDFLVREDGYSTERSQSVRDSLDGQDVHPLLDDVWPLLRRWAGLSFSEAVHCDGNWERPPSPADSLTFTRTPAIIMRTRGSDTLAQLYQHIAASLEKPGARAPLGLVQLVKGLEAEERLAWTGSHADGARAGDDSSAEPLLPLPANEDQRLVLDRIRSDTAVVVQGPPGTGKTHTIANLLCALLADGKRVLVTSQKEQALRELRDKLPEKIRDLCVAHTGVRRDGTDDFGRSMTTLAERLSSASVSDLNRDIQAYTRRRGLLLSEEARLREQIRQPREAEWAMHAEVAPGYSGTLAEIAYQVARTSPRFAWVESLDPVIQPAAGESPLSAAEGDELRALLTSRVGTWHSRQGQRFPDCSAIPSAETFEQVVSAARQAEIASGSVPAASRQFADLSKSVLRDVERHVVEAAVAAHPLNLPERLSAWPKGRWEAVVLRDMLGRGSLEIYRDVDTAARQVAGTRRGIVQMAARNVTIPERGPGETVELIRVAAELRRYLLEGKRLRPRFMAGREQRDAERLLSACRVDGRPPADPDELEAVIALLNAEAIAAYHAKRWESAGFVLSAASAPELLRELSQRYSRLRCLGAIKCARDDVNMLLARQGLRMAGLNTPEDWDALRDALPAVQAVSIARQCAQEYARFHERLPAPTLDELPELGALRSAVRSGDIVGYRDALSSIDSAFNELVAQRRCEDLLGRLRAWHPRLADELARTATDPAWEERLRSLPAAMAWLAARTFCEGNHRADSDNELHRRLDEVQLRLARETASLAAARAWLHLTRRITEQDRLAIRQYRAATSKLGKGTGVHASANRRAARMAMKDAMGAVPAWIMPVRKVAETVPAQPDSFDVVIIDEASQSKLDSVFLLWLAPRVIAVGDDKQCAPGFDQKHESYRDRLSARLPGLNEHQMLGLSPGSSLYDLLSVQFPAQIMLTEHFRSMPEIISWSSQLFYEDRLVPLRQFGPDRLPPLQVCQIEDGLVDGRDDGIHNDPEAKHIVEKLRELLESPDYTASKPKTFSIIALQGKSQAQRIRSMIRESFPPDTIARHDIRIGDPPDFQGAESDVVMLSMIVTRPLRSLTGPQERRRFNVAATRARDQMWLFTSVERNRLQAEDLRSLLLSHMEAPPSPLSQSPSADEVSDSELQDPFDSVFEQRVFRAIRQHGYHVTPQHKVGDYRIDLVVSGSGRKLAIECDGPIPYGDIAQIARDLSWERKLRNAGWRFWRVRESEFALNPEQAIAPLWLELADCGISPEENDSQQSQDQGTGGGSHD
jgi:very-short-patch-repair endonuclease